MKSLSFLFLLIALRLTLITHAYTVSFSNVNIADQTAVPILNNSYQPIPLNSGFIAVGTFPGNVDPASIEDIRAFKIFGEGDTSINSSIGLGGFVTGTRSAPIPEGTIDSPVNESVYVVIGDGVDLASSKKFAVLDTGSAIGTDPDQLKIIIDSETLIPERLIFGSIISNLDIGIGLVFSKAIQLEFLDCGGERSSDLTYSITNGSVTITGANQFETITSLAIPETIDGNPVTAIGKNAFSLPEENDGQLVCFTIPDSVTSIGEGAFTENYNLKSVIIGNGVKSIGSSAFSYCYGLKNVQIGNSVTTIGDLAFWYCELKSIIIPDSVKSIGREALGENYNLRSVIIGNGVKSVGEAAFKGCRITNITFRGAAPTAGFLAFDGGLAKEGATAYVLPQFADSFGGLGSTWEGLTVEILKPTITACGLTTPQTFFIEFEPAGEGCRVMSSPTLDFGNAVEIRPTLQPTSGSDNRFEFTASGSRNFYRLELTE